MSIRPLHRLSSFVVVALLGGTLSGISAQPTATAAGRPIGPLSPLFANFEAKGPHLVRLLAGAFDPLDDPLPHGAAIPFVKAPTLPAATAQYWLIQVRGQRFATAQSAIAAAGGTVAGYVQDDTYLVSATPAQRASIASSPAVLWTGYYQPAWRVPVAAAGKPGLMQLEGTQVYRVYAFREDPRAASLASALKAIPGVKVVENAGVVVDARATAAQVGAIASIPYVEWVGIKPRGVLMNYNARWVTDTGVRDVFAATRAGRLNGAGQTAADADTGLNYTYDLNHRAHVAFRDCDSNGVCKQAIYTQVAAGNSTAALTNVQDNNTNHRKMVAYFDLAGTGPNPFDESSHGSHTAGSVDGDQPPYDKRTGDDGMAPAANHVHQNVGTATGGLALPSDDYQLWRQAYRPRKPASVSTTSPDAGNPVDGSPSCVDPPDPLNGVALSNCYRPLEDARTHNNSYGLIAPVVDDGSSTDIDKFVWDHEDMVIVVSAGNGVQGQGTSGSISSPSVAKNDMSSGASANGRQPMASIDTMAPFSSHGPTGDGRYGVDLATPGQVVVSVKGGTTRGYHVAQGTSMSAPILTGLSTLVRQYFWDGYGPAGGKGFAGGTKDIANRRWNPSAALVKATLVNGAARMRGFYTGDDGTTRNLDGQWPSAGQGFGRVNLDNSLYFANDPVNTWYHDVWRGDAEAFAVSNGPDSRSYEIHVEKGQPLDVSLDYTDAPDQLPAGTPALVNNLDLTVTGPDSTEYTGNVTNTRTDPSADVATSTQGPPDTKNPTERVRIAAPESGTYTITVSAEPVVIGNQGFALAASGLISAVNGPSFTPGPPLQADRAGSPKISRVHVSKISADTAKITFRTSEPTTAVAMLGQGKNAETFVDSYNVGPGGFPGLNEGPVETSAEYADKPVLGRRHEILLTGLSRGRHRVTLVAKDLAKHETSRRVSFRTSARTWQADAPDIAQCDSAQASPPNTNNCNWTRGTQMYAGNGGGDDLIGAWMFRVPERAIDPSKVVGAVVETFSTHNWVPPYTQDPVLNVDLLDESVEPDWGTQDYDGIKSAPKDARLNPETTYKVGAYQRYSWAFGCADLAKLRKTLSTVQDGQRRAAFRYEGSGASDAALFAMDFGFNRRSRGPDLRPKLVLLTAQHSSPQEPPCNPDAPRPKISGVGIHPGTIKGSMTLSWHTNVASDSMVLFRQKGTKAWTQVGTPGRVNEHQVEVLGLDSKKHYTFVVRSMACNGKTSTKTNGGAGWDFFRAPVSLGPGTVEASYDFETGTDGWTEHTDDHQDPNQPVDTKWVHGTPGASDTKAPDGSRPEDSSKNGWNAKPYQDQDDAFLTSPAKEFSGTLAAVRFYENHDMENPVEGATTTGDGLQVQFSTDGGKSWKSAAIYQGTSAGYPNYIPHTVTFPNATAGKIRVRFDVTSDDNISSPPYEGASVDKVDLVSYSPPPSTEGPLPLTGPVPPPSANATGLKMPPTRKGFASKADIDAGTAVCLIPRKADLSIQKSAVQRNPRIGDHIVYNLIIRNNGPDRAPRVAVTDVLPAAERLVSAHPSKGACKGKATVTCAIGKLGPGKRATIRVVAKAVKAGRAVNVATITAAVKDPKLGNNRAEAALTIAGCPAFEGAAGNQIVGTRKNETLVGTSGRDIICGQGGDDTIKGLGGNDILAGGSGNDVVTGGRGDDRVIGKGGDDRLSGDRGQDYLAGRKGDDRVGGGPGGDTLRGGDDSDLIGAKDGVHDTVDGGRGRDTCLVDRKDAVTRCP